jgi:glyoxylase-like metal-dependent hydrolase (beta-lactamase superfamily II)
MIPERRRRAQTVRRGASDGRIGNVEWTEVSAGVFVRPYPQDDLTITVIRGASGLLLVDTASSPTDAARIQSDAEQLGELVGIVNTHAHYDHTFGNQHFRAPAAKLPIYGHHRVPAHLAAFEAPRLAAWRTDPGSEPPREWHDVVITPPTTLVHERTWIDLGDRDVELIPLDAGHTDGDVVIRVPARGAEASDTWIVGDVIEEPGPPMYGSGCFPIRWPATLSSLLDEVGDDDVIIPGHGRPVTRAFGRAQLAVLAATADVIRRHHDAGDDVARALRDPEDWAYPVAALELAVRRGYEELDGRL